MLGEETLIEGTKNGDFLVARIVDGDVTVDLRLSCIGAGIGSRSRRSSSSSSSSASISVTESDVPDGLGEVDRSRGCIGEAAGRWKRN